MEIVAAENPDLANAVIDKILAGPAQDAEPVKVSSPPDTHVELPGGYLTETSLIRDAEVKELTGFDEEELSKTTTSARYFQTLLQRGVVRVGDEKPDSATFNRMLAGDRDMLILAIRKATYGTEIEIQDLECPHCRKLVDVTIDLDRDVRVSRLESAQDRQFTVQLSRGEATVHLPDGVTQQAVLTAEGKTNAELNTLVLRQCVEDINGVPVISEDSVRRLTVKDRQTVIDALNKREIGPQLNAVTKACPLCEEDINLPLSLGGLFQF